MHVVLRTGLLSWLTLLALTALGDGALAVRNLFENDYRDCPASVRLAGLTGLQAVRTDKDDELQVEWDRAPWASWNLQGGTAEITIRVAKKDRTQTLPSAHKALGATNTTFKDVDLATDWIVQAAVTDRGKVISDIVEVAFTSGVKKPVFSSHLYYEVGHTTKLAPGVTAGSDADKSDNKDARIVGSFYYLGFNKYFDNWYAEGDAEGFDRGPGSRYPDTAKFRVGLRHGVDNPGDARFDHFRIRVEDGNGDNILGFDAQTVEDNVYRHGVEEFALRVLSFPTSQKISNVAESNRVHDDGIRVAAIHEHPSTLGPLDIHNLELWQLDGHLDLSALPYQFQAGYNSAACGVQIDSSWATFVFANLRKVADELSFAALRTFTGNEVGGTPSRRYLYAELPHQIYDLPKDIFSRDGTFTLTAWAEDDKNNRISPQASITFSVQERLNQKAKLQANYVRTSGVRVNDPLYVRRNNTALGGVYYSDNGTPTNYADDRCIVDIPRRTGAGAPSYAEFYDIVPSDIRNDALVIGLTVTKK